MARPRIARCQRTGCGHKLTDHGRNGAECEHFNCPAACRLFERYAPAPPPADAVERARKILDEWWSDERSIGLTPAESEPLVALIAAALAAPLQDKGEPACLGQGHNAGFCYVCRRYYD